MDAFNSIFGFIQSGFNDMRTNLMAIVIAFIVAFFVMKKWGQLLVMTVVATVVHLLAVAFVKPLITSESISMPPLMDMAYWMTALSVAVGYLIMLIVLFFLKNNVFKMGGGGSHHCGVRPRGTNWGAGRNPRPFCCRDVGGFGGRSQLAGSAEL
jgi:hypothetical protein